MEADSYQRVAGWALVVEPDSRLGAVLRELLRNEGLDPVHVRDGSIALRVLEEQGVPRLLITGLSLPGADGFELLRTLRAQVPAAVCPALVISAFDELRRRAWQLRDQLGIHTLLPFGSTRPLLERAIKHALSRPAASVPERPRGDRQEADALRLQALHRLGLGSGANPDPKLQQLVAEVARVFDVPVALISLTLDEKQHFEAYVGLEGQLAQERGMPRNLAFCAHAVEAGKPLVVPDATRHPVFHDNPFVTAGLVRGYAGAPLVGAAGDVLGTLCILDRVPLVLDADRLDTLVALARSVAGELEARARGAAEGPELTSIAAAVLDELDEGACVFDESRRIVLANAAFGRIFSAPPSGFVGLTRDELFEWQAQQFDDPEAFRRLMRIGETGPWVLLIEFEMERPRRVVRWFGRPLLSGGRRLQLATCRDVTGEAELLEERERLARTDWLTGLANRRAAEEALAREAARADRSNSRLAVVMFDVDHFKRVNDKAGHAVGDEALRAVARALLTAARRADLVSRWGGEEFLALLPDGTPEGALAFAERARRLVAEILLEDYGRLSVSAGISERRPREPLHVALERADRGLYQAKQAGRNQVVEVPAPKG